MAETGGSARRERKQVDFFAPPEVKKDTEKLVIKQGKGIKIRDIPNVLFNLEKVKASEALLEDLHQLMYRRKGKGTTRKTDIRDFSGFVYADDVKEAERTKDLAKLNSFPLAHIHAMMDLLDIPRGAGDKDAKAARVWEFLDAPAVMSAVDKAAKAAKKRELAAKKRVKGKGGKAGSAVKKPRKSKGGDEEGEQEGEESGDEAAPAKKKKTPAGKAGAAKAAPKRKAAAKEEKPRKRAKKASKGKSEEEEEESDDDIDVPLGAVALMPADDDLEKAALEILASVDVQEFSLRGLLAQLEEKYKLAAGALAKHKAKKDLVKRTAIIYCATKAADAGGEEESEEGEEPGAANGRGEEGDSDEGEAEEEEEGDKEEAGEEEGGDEEEAEEEEGKAAGDAGGEEKEGEGADAGDEEEEAADS